MPTIRLTRGQKARVDWLDYSMLAEHKWHARWDTHIQSFYAVRSVPGGAVHMARQILGLEPGDKRQADHIDHDTLDNRRVKLRIVSNRANQENRRDQSINGVGVERRRDRQSRPYRVRVHVDGKSKNLGCFATPEEAREARNRFLGTLP